MAGGPLLMLLEGDQGLAGVRDCWEGVGGCQVVVPARGALSTTSGCAKMGTVPLSEEEQRILSEIERSFYENDPATAERLRSETVYSHAGRHVRWGVAGLIFGLVVIVAFFTTNIPVALGGFLVMLASGVVVVQNVRRLGKASLADLAAASRRHRLAGSAQEVRDKLRKRFRRDV
jgi:hypothetical protein